MKRDGNDRPRCRSVYQQRPYEQLLDAKCSLNQAPRPSANLARDEALPLDNTSADKPFEIEPFAGA